MIVMKRIHLLDRNRSCLSLRETKKFRSEITKQKNSPICSATTTEVAKRGFAAMKVDKFKLIKEQLDV